MGLYTTMGRIDLCLPSTVRGQGIPPFTVTCDGPRPPRSSLLRPGKLLDGVARLSRIPDKRRLHGDILAVQIGWKKAREKLPITYKCRLHA
jgi:hypothetical protein